ncbi:hypothetical protein L6452_05675 [Arctium lappa]|uniref:Uncharacterized protein n=1 Tax=Arctium lappa TaxID=4217 RepID=A0ACB9EHD1_ARCLA|nr:hypothetical protein L6452_05675 [Arctium lappa]
MDVGEETGRLRKYDYVTNEQSGYGLESCGQGPSESNSNFPVSQHPTVDGKFTSTTFCSATVESCSVAGGDKSLQTSTYRIEVEGSKTSFEEEVETEASQEGKHPMVGEFHLELDGRSDLKYNEVATVLTKRSNYIKKQDNSLVIYPPNVVPLSDEWLAVSCWRGNTHSLSNTLGLIEGAYSTFDSANHLSTHQLL